MRHSVAVCVEVGFCAELLVVFSFVDAVWLSAEAFSVNFDPWGGQ